MTVIDLTEFEGAGERFKFLIQPVKDLAANWDLDIAKTLEDYIRKVVEETNRVNFAEAALLIHGTTTVYARKVEYVLQQAQNFFEYLREDENHERQQRGKRGKGALVTNCNVDHVSMGHFIERLSLRRSPFLPVIPIAYFPLTDIEKRAVSLCTRTNPAEVFGKKDDFKLNSCHVHDSIALLDIKSISIISKFSQLAINSQKQRELVPVDAEPMHGADDAEPMHGADTGFQLQVVPDTDFDEYSAHEIDREAEPGTPCSHAPTVQLLEEKTEPSLELLNPDEIVTDQSRPFRRKPNCAMSAITQIRARDRRIERDCREKGVPNVTTIKHYIETHVFRHQLKKSSSVFGNTFLADKAVLALNPLFHEEEKRRAELRKRRRKEIQNAQRGERAMRRAMREREVDPVMEHPAGSDGEQTDGEAKTEQSLSTNDDEPLDGLIAEGIIDENDGQSEHQNLGDILEMEDLENSFGRLQNLYAGFEHLNTVQRKRAKSLATRHKFYDDTIFTDGGINPDDLPPRPISQMDYDEIIAFHLRKYWTASELATSMFSEQIRQWEMRMTKVLEEENLRREFCTSIYGDELLERFGGQIESEIDFTKMLVELPNDYDRSRFLLVSLILANMDNVQLITSGESDENERITLRLLSLNRREFSL